jgi:hypothetical protein
MAQFGNNDRFGGEFMVQDSDHMSGIDRQADKANRGNVRQTEQSHSAGRQQGSGDHGTAHQQGGRRRQAQ